VPDLTQTTEWKKLAEHAAAMSQVHMRDLFADDTGRFENNTLYFNDILIDYSKNITTEETKRLLMNLARARDVQGWSERMFRGDAINNTENRAALHTALRNRSNRPVLVDGKDVMPDVNR